MILDGAKEHYILDIEHSDKAIGLLKFFYLRYLTLRRKRSETDEAVSKHQKRPALFKILIVR